jgi:phosphoserine phosphatase RsbU/P
MPTPLIAGRPDTREVLLERRGLLETARRQARDPGLEALIRDVDAALDRLSRGTYGICDVCHEEIGHAHLDGDPVARCCVEHPTPEESARIQRDLALARDLQRGLLPRAGLALAGWEYGYRYEAAREVGGDLCDVVPLPAGDGTLIVVGDVVGKGVAASVLMSSLVATFRSLASVGLPAGELLARVNNLFHLNTRQSSYATLAAAALRPDGAVDLYSAGHWPPLLRRGRSVEPAPVVSNLPIGLFEGTEYTPARLRLDPGDTLLFYTDGVSDAQNGAGDLYTTERLAGVLACPGDRDLDALVDRCLRDVQDFQHGQPTADDLTLLAIRAGSGRSRVAVQ